MPNSKDNPRYNVVSLRITAEEKAALDEVSQRTHKTSQRSCGKRFSFTPAT